MAKAELEADDGANENETQCYLERRVQDHWAPYWCLHEIRHDLQ
jgi:hypothetical protein